MNEQVKVDHPDSLCIVGNMSRTTSTRVCPPHRICRFRLPLGCSSGYVSPRNKKAQPCGLG